MRFLQNSYPRQINSWLSDINEAPLRGCCLRICGVWAFCCVRAYGGNPDVGLYVRYTKKGRNPYTFWEDAARRVYVSTQRNRLKSYMLWDVAHVRAEEMLLRSRCLKEEMVQDGPSLIRRSAAPPQREADSVSPDTRRGLAPAAAALPFRRGMAVSRISAGASPCPTIYRGILHFQTTKGCFFTATQYFAEEGMRE